jgi:hypothetical protein
MTNKTRSGLCARLARLLLFLMEIESSILVLLLCPVLRLLECSLAVNLL